MFPILSTFQELKEEREYCFLNVSIILKRNFAYHWEYYHVYIDLLLIINTTEKYANGLIISGLQY